MFCALLWSPLFFDTSDYSTKHRVTRLVFLVSVLHIGVSYILTGTLDLQKRSSSILRDEEPCLYSTTDNEHLNQAPPFTILGVKREIVADGVKFSVKFESRATPFNAQWHNTLGERGEGTTIALGNGMFETSALIPLPEASDSSYDDYDAYNQLEPWLFLTTSDYSDGITLSLRHGEEDAVVSEVPVPILETEPKGDFVYEEGEDFTFKIRLDSEGLDIGSPAIVTFLDLDTGDLVRNLAYKYIDQIDWQEYPNYQELSLRINTSVSRLCGVVDVQTGVRGDGDIINNVIKAKDIIVRPSTQAGPFPDGYLGIVKMDENYEYEFLRDQMYCKIGEPCVSRCLAAGQDITEMTFERLRADGATERLDNPSHLIEDFTTPYTRLANVRFQEDTMPEDPEKIRCTTKNAGGTMVSMETTVRYTIPVNIIEEDSGIEENNQDNVTVKTFKISCTVMGNPTPTVNFNTINQGTVGYPTSPDEIVNVGNNTYLAVKYESFDAEGFEQSVAGLAVICLARQDYPFWFFDEYSIAV